MPPLVDLTGQRFNRLTVLSLDVVTTQGAQWNCVCDCGTKCIIRSISLRKGATKSCGCLRQEVSRKKATKHGHSPGWLGKKKGSRTYQSYLGMMARCHNKNYKDYINYGARGIKVCTRWFRNFSAFLEDMGERPEGTSIGRLNNDLGYFPSNCAWQTPKEQANNRRKSRIVITLAHRAAISAANKGKPVSPKTRRKLRIAQLRHHGRSEEEIKDLLAGILDGSTQL